MAHTTTTPGRPSWTHDDFLLPPPNPTQRLNLTLDPRDVHRLELHAALTTAGVAPMPGDREAIDHLSTLPDYIHTALHRWLTHTTQQPAPSREAVTDTHLMKTLTA